MSIITALSLLLTLTLGSGGGTAAELSGSRPAPGKLLVSSEGTRDPNFAETVVLLITYDEGGAMGLVLNRRSDVKLSEVLPDVERLKSREDPVYFGGPVSKSRMFLLARSETPLELARPVVDDVQVSESPQLLEQLLEKGGEAEFRAFAGYAGWGAGQLDGEIERGGWHIVAGSAERIFAERPAALWRSLVPRNKMEWSRLIPAGE
jgi:putative transcriptional regulator